MRHPQWQGGGPSSQCSGIIILSPGESTLPLGIWLCNAAPPVSWDKKHTCLKQVTYMMLRGGCVNPIDAFLLLDPYILNTGDIFPTLFSEYPTSWKDSTQTHKVLSLGWHFSQVFNRSFFSFYWASNFHVGRMDRCPFLYLFGCKIGPFDWCNIVLVSKLSNVC